MADAQLYDASARGDVSEVGHLLAAGAQSEGYRGEVKDTTLHRAALSSHVDVVEKLQVHGADIHAVTDTGRTPLQAGAWCGRVDVVHLLLKKGAQLEYVWIRMETYPYMRPAGGDTLLWSG